MSQTGNILGLDIGGANIKLATDDGSYLKAVTFAMWKQHSQLTATIESLLTEYTQSGGILSAIAVTMTGELADCFESKKEGVVSICESVSSATRDTTDVHFYMTDGQWCHCRDARKNWERLAASNWHATANLAAKLRPSGASILLDIGTTTTDIIPIKGGEVATTARDDLARLQAGQLVYCGVERTPLCSLLSEFQLDSVATPIARELFATTLDVFLLTGEIAERPNCTATADGKPATREYAKRRLSRMICECPDLIQPQQLDAMIHQARKAIVDLIAKAFHKVSSSLNTPADSIIAAGQANFLNNELRTDAEVISLETLCSVDTADLARIGPAYAVASLLKQDLSETQQ